MNKKIISILLAVLLLVSSLYGCSNKSSNTSNDTKKMNIVCTIFPQYDWVRQILGNLTSNTELTFLLDKGVDLHSYQPTVDDIVKVSECDLFIYVGGESDEWVEDVLKSANNKDMVVLNLLEVLGDSVKEEEVVEGMEEEEHDHEHEEGEENEQGLEYKEETEHAEEANQEDEADREEEVKHEEETEYDEHVWLSLKNTKIICEVIRDALISLDADHAETYKNNASDYLANIQVLDKEYQRLISEANRRTILFGDRFPFRYLAEDYGLDYYAAFAGCSAETEASFETITFLSEKVDELSIPVVLIIESSDQKIAQTIIENTTSKDQKVLVLNSIQSVTAQDVEAGVTYMKLMQDNLLVLTEALK
jgi:zinc transport system substrate-binding protein